MKYITLSLLALASVCYAQEKKKDPPTPKTIDELRTAIIKVLDDTKTPGVGIAIVNKNGPIWIAGLGKANVENNVEADSLTMFRIGSISKMFVALSILKLQEEGKVSLNDKVHDLVPDLEYNNPWEETNPILVAHLLEHTTGWDDIHMVEYAHNESVPIGLKEALAFHPHSRTSRWVPGSRMSYCNSGPPAAALIVEKITGKKFEDYVEENFFRPMGMSTMTYFKSPEYDKKGATLYIAQKSQDYWHVIVRASGSINASAVDMAKFVQFYVNGGKVNTLALISPASLTRMETPGTTPAAQAGMKDGYALGNYTTSRKGFVFHGHNGGVNGGVSDLSYQPELGVGYAMMINSDSGDALDRISKLIRDFLIQDAKPAGYEKPTTVKVDEKQSAILGYYRPINPRNEMFHFVERLVGKHNFSLDSTGIKGSNFIGAGTPNHYAPLSDVLYTSTETGITSLAVVNDPLDGEVVHAGTNVFQKTSWFNTYVPLIIICLWLVFMATAVIYMFVWVIRYYMKKIPAGLNVQVRLWPLMATIFFLALSVLVGAGIGDPFKKLGFASDVSIGIMLLTIAFAVSGLLSFYFIVKARKDANVTGFGYWHSAIGASLHLIVTIYFLYWGVVGMRTWV